MTIKPFELPAHVAFDEPMLRFGGDPLVARDVHPLRGLLNHGPFTKDKLAAVADPIRVATICPSGQRDKLINLLRELYGRHTPRERRQFLLEYPGFTKVFGVKILPAGDAASYELGPSLTTDVLKAERPHAVLAEAITQGLRALRLVRDQFDVVLILLSKEWEVAFKETKTEDFDLHDYIKATAAADGIPVQVVKETGAISYYCRCSVMWRLSTALYTKAGGIPWVLADLNPGTAYIGIDYAIRPNPGSDSRFAICCSQVFDAEGSGLEFIAYEADGVRLFGKNPFLRRDQMMKVVARSLAIYQRKHTGALPTRVVIHKNTEFKSEEVDGCFDALMGVKDVELVQIQQECGWRGIQISGKHQVHGYPVLRGSSFQLGPQETLLWTQGNLPEVTETGRADYFKEGKGVPEPLLLTRYAGFGPTDDLCREVLALTKMDWNNDGPYDRIPVTLSYAQILASVVKRMPKLEPHSYAFRLFM